MRLSISIIIAILMMGFASCSTDSDVDNKNPINSITADPIAKIIVSSQPELFKEFELTEQDYIQAITDYLENIHPVKISSKGESLNGSAYVLEISYKGSDSKKAVLLVGNMYIIVFDDYDKEQFFDENDSVRFVEISYEEATVFDTVLTGIMIDRYRKDESKTIVSGRVVSIVGSSCSIERDDGTIAEIYTNDAYTLDTTGTGWIVLHEGDLIEMVLPKYPEDDSLVYKPEMIFITKPNPPKE